MEPRHEERRLTTILSADVAGYSRLMAADESGTLAQLKAHRKELIEPKTAEYHGRVVKLMGDGTLMEFGSVVDAVRFAVDFQRAMLERNASVPEDLQITYRVGINIGDIIVEGDDIYGDGVNIAARLERLAEPGGICVSRTVFNHVKKKVDLGFEDLGEQEVKNIPEPLRVYRVELAQTEAPRSGSVTAAEQTLTLPDKPSIAVLAFDNMSGDPEQEFLADGMTEEILNLLAQFPELFVIAGTSSFTFKGRSVDVRAIGKQLGVRYVLEGSIRAAGDRVRISAQLIDAKTGAHVWADHYDRKTGDIFDVQDEVAAKIAATLEPQLLIAEGSRYKRTHPDSLGAWGSVIRGLNRLWRFTKEDFGAALEEADHAIALSPEYGLAYAIRTCALGYRSWAHWGDDWYQDAVGAIAAFKQLQALGSSDSTSLGSAAIGIMFMGRFKQAHEIFETVIQMNPNFAIARGINGYALGCLGHGDEGLAMIDTAIRLSPRDPLHPLFLAGKALCYFVKAEYEDSISAAAESIRLNPNFLDSYLYKAASHAERGETEHAKKEIQRALRLAPDITVKKVCMGEQWPDGWANYTGAVARAGLPEE